MEERKDEPAAPSAPRPPPIDIIQKITGAFGKYQFLLCILIFLSKFPVAFHQMAIIFLSPKVVYICPSTGNETCPCPDPIYDTSIFIDTIIMEWNLICERQWLVSTTQTLFQLGVLIGSVLFGMASDRYGRKYPLILAMIMKVIFGITAAFARGYWTFTMIRFVLGVSVGGSIVVTFVILMEFIGSQYRDTVSALYHIPFNLGHVMLPVFAYFFRDYVHFQLSISVPSIILLIYICLVPETPRWLIAMKRNNEAIAVLERVAKTNKRPTENIRADVEAYQASIEKQGLKKGNILDLFRTPNLRKHILAMSFNWLNCSYCFYGVSQYVGQISGNLFIHVAEGGIMAAFGTIISIPLLKVMRRKTILIVFNSICVICFLALTVMPDGAASMVCAVIATICSFILFVVVYLYCTELFPTVVRNAAVGVSSMSARVGGMIAPFVVYVGGEEHDWMPPLGFAILPAIAIFVTLLLPETKGCELMNTIEEGENFGKKDKSTEKK